MKKALHGTFVAIGLLACAASAQAALITIEPDDFAVGTDISAAVSGLVLLSQSPAGAVYAGDFTGFASTGNLVFGRDDQGSGVDWGSGLPDFRADFLSPVAFVQIDILSNDSVDFGQFIAYDSGNNQIDYFETPVLPFPGFQTVTFSHGAADIAYVMVFGSSVNAETISIDNLRFDTVVSPEPATFALFGLGAAAVGVTIARRRRRK